MDTSFELLFLLRQLLMLHRIPVTIVQMAFCRKLISVFYLIHMEQSLSCDSFIQVCRISPQYLYLKWLEEMCILEHLLLGLKQLKKVK